MTESLKTFVAGDKITATDTNNNNQYLENLVSTSASTLQTYFNQEITRQVGQLSNEIIRSDYIDGLIISKSADDTIGVSAGSCYDSTRLVILALGNATTKQNASQAAIRTYYVYIVGDGTNVDIVIDTSASIPTLPTGYNYYRQIGSYTTNSNGKINNIITSETAKLLQSGNRTIVEVSPKSILPFWYRIYSDRWCEQGGIYQKGQGEGYWRKDNKFALLKEFDGDEYTVLGNAGHNTTPQTEANWYSTGWVAFNKTTTEFQGEAWRGNSGNFQYNRLYWYACGYLAE